MKRTITQNANWLRLYESNIEVSKLLQLNIIKKLRQKKDIRIVDIGCGNGRSLKLLNTLFPNAHITAIDKIEENIQYAIQHIELNNIEYAVCDAVEHFSIAHEKFFDLALFSWSFFDMVNESNQKIKEEKLKCFLDSIIANLDDDGTIIVLQPTKGGTFEKLLSLFMPSSDEIYAFTHSFLKSYGFIGPETIIPLLDDPLGIWSEFKYHNDDELFHGIASVLNLEINEVLTPEKYHEIIHKFRIENNLPENELITLSDCVNIYYLHKGAGHA